MASVPAAMSIPAATLPSTAPLVFNVTVPRVVSVFPPAVMLVPDTVRFLDPISTALEPPRVNAAAVRVAEASSPTTIVPTVAAILVSSV